MFPVVVVAGVVSEAEHHTMYHEGLIGRDVDECRHCQTHGLSGQIAVGFVVPFPALDKGFEEFG